jgi:MtfA peptidase
MPGMPVLLAIVGLTVWWVLWLAGQPLWTELRWARVRRRPFPAAWRDVLRRRVPYVRSLPADLQLQLKKHIQVFVAEKPFIGCAGLQVTEEMRVTIAAQACLLLLNRRRPGYYPNLRQILLYPGAFLVQRVHADGTGVQQDQRRALAGESWSQGQVILSWEDSLQGAAITDDGHNVVIHEFAHQLDQENGPANGAPLLPRRGRYPAGPAPRGGSAEGLSSYARWSQVLGEEFRRLQAQVERGEATFFSAYGATDPAEFFAVVSEVFFEQPHSMAAGHPALYAELRGLYRVDPLNW